MYEVVINKIPFLCIKQFPLHQHYPLNAAMYQAQNTNTSGFTKDNYDFFRNYFFAQNLSFSPAAGYKNGDYQLFISNNIYYLFNTASNTIALIIDGVNEEKAINLANLYLSNPVY